MDANPPETRKLEREPEAAPRAEAREDLARIREAVAYYKFQPDDLFGKFKSPRANGPTRKDVSTAKKVVRRKTAVKYRDESGNTWTGRGSKPRWLLAAMDTGKTMQDFAV